MPCNCGGRSARSKRLSVAATKKATNAAVKGIRIPKAQPKKVPPKKVAATKAKPCKCTA